MSIEGGLIAIELTASAFANDRTIVDIIGTVTFLTIQLGAVVLPRKWITGAAILFKAVGTLALIGDEHIVVAAGANDDTVVRAKDTGLLVLAVGGKRNILNGTIIVAGGLDMADAFVLTGLYLTEMAWIADDARQLTWHRMKLCVEEEITPIPAINGILAVAGNE